MSRTQFISLHQGAKELGIAIPTLYKWIERGKLHPVRLGEGGCKFPKQKLRSDEVEALKGK